MRRAAEPDADIVVVHGGRRHVLNETFRASPGDDPPIPLFHFRTTGLPGGEAFAEWRERMAPLFHIEQARYSSLPPRGNLSVFMVGEIMANQCTFTAQHLWRDPALIAATPNHLVLQYYRSGGFRGMIGGRPVTIVRGQVCVADLGLEVDAYAATSDTIGLSIPRSMLGDIDPHLLALQLDPSRNRLLGGYMSTLPKRLKQMKQSDILALSAELVALLGRIFAHGPLVEGAMTSSTNETLLARAVTLIEARLGTPDLSPSVVAEELGASRATLYRLFAPMGGVMRYAQERRLLAVCDILNDPLDRRPLAQVAAMHGFASQAVFSRAFRSRFGLTPREWRNEQVRHDLPTGEYSHELAHLLWHNLGRARGEP